MIKRAKIQIYILKTMRTTGFCVIAKHQNGAHPYRVAEGERPETAIAKRKNIKSPRVSKPCVPAEGESSAAA